MNHSPTPSTICISGNSSTTNSVNSGKKCEGKLLTLFSVFVYTCTAQMWMHMRVSVQTHAGICVQRPEDSLHCCFFKRHPPCDCFMVLETKTGNLVSREFDQQAILATQESHCLSFHRDHMCISPRSTSLHEFEGSDSFSPLHGKHLTNRAISTDRKVYQFLTI